jgi:hypothetical protein
MLKIARRRYEDRSSLYDYLIIKRFFSVQHGGGAQQTTPAEALWVSALPFLILGSAQTGQDAVTGGCIHIQSNAR